MTKEIEETIPNAERHPILVTGAAGMLGRDVVNAAPRRGLTIFPAARADLDITRADQCRQVIHSLEPAAVIHCAAYTNVNQAEFEPELATEINSSATGNLARACSQLMIPIIVISTDYVFDGTSPDPYDETSPTNPLNAYGRSKRQGELLAMAEAPLCCAVVRTSWLYGRHGANFVSTMLKAARAGKHLRVVADQIGSPTYTVDLAELLLDLAQHALVTPTRPLGIFHVTAAGSCSWYEFAEAIFEMAQVQPVSLCPVSSAEFPSPARRPANSRLASRRLQQLGIAPIAHWKNGLKRYLEEMGELAPSQRELTQEME